MRWNDAPGWKGQSGMGIKKEQGQKAADTGLARSSAVVLCSEWGGGARVCVVGEWVATPSLQGEQRK